MSGSTTPPEPISDAERVAIRRHLGYPAYGAEDTWNAGWRFFQHYGALEYRLGNLSPAELVEIRRQVAIVEGLDAAALAAADNLDTDVAAVWHRNRGEVRDRERLLYRRRVALAGFLGIPMGPMASSCGSSMPVVV